MTFHDRSVRQFLDFTRFLGYGFIICIHSDVLRLIKIIIHKAFKKNTLELNENSLYNIL